MLALTDGWTVRPLGTSHANAADWPLTATVPGCVHADLLRHGVIPDPFLDDNELAVQWVGEADWEYRCDLAVSEAALDCDRLDLVFAGLDTLASIELNGHEVARTENMHRDYRFDVSGLVRPGSNELRIVFSSAAREAERRRQRLGYWPSSSFDQPFNYVRKMACAWGWDWGPQLTTAGVWRPAALDAWDSARLASVRPLVRIDEADAGAVDVQLTVARAKQSPLAVEVVLSRPGTSVRAAGTLDADESTLDLALDAGRVDRWWPHDRGEQPLYDLAVTLADEAGTTLDRWERRVGFRTIELETTPDSYGSPFTLVVNGQPLFARGLNWIPDDPLVSRVDATRYRSRLENLRDLGANLVRVWGGGIYEDGAFYDACDQLGLLVWQDFAFACASYPEDLLSDEVAAEARANVERLMPHPSLALWNGNNENQWGFADWGWQEPLAGRPWGAGFYDEVLPDALHEVDPTRPYSAGSPYSGSADIHPNADANGTRHIWDVWNDVDYRTYRAYVPRFASEFGWQAPPTWPTLRAAIADERLTPDSPGMAHHQKATDGNGKLSRGLQPFFAEPDDFDAWLWAMQLNQARALRTGVEHFRSHRGLCMGTVVWQFNDCWPVTSWSVLDSEGGRKPAWYALRAAYAPRLVTIQPRGDRLIVAAVNDTAEPWATTIHVARLDFAGRPLAMSEHPVRVEPDGLTTVVLDEAISTPADRAGELVSARSDAAPAWWFFAPDRELHYPACEVDVDVRGEPNGCLDVTVKAHTLVRDLALFPDRLVGSAHADEQLVTLAPGDETTIRLHGLGGIDEGRWDRLGAPPTMWSANDLVVA